MRVLICLPHNGGVRAETMEAILRFASKEEGWIDTGRADSSSPAENFNECWRVGLNTRKERDYTHIAYIHHDIQPEHWWLDRLAEQMAITGADYISSVVTIKDDRYTTSTGILDPATGVACRFTVNELDDAPDSFTAPEGKILLANTGMLLCRFDKPWAARLHFRNLDDIFFVRKSDGGWITQDAAADLETLGKLPEGEYVAANWTEDWNLSIQMWKLGLKVYATKAVQCLHYGTARWRNWNKGESRIPGVVDRGRWDHEQQPIDARWVLKEHCL